MSPTVTTIRVLEKFIDSHLKSFEWLKGSILSELAGSRNDMQAGYILFMQRGSILFCSGSVCGENKKSLTLFKIVREGFTCGRLAMIHSSRVRTELFPAGAPLGV